MADDDVPLAALAKKPSLSKVTDDTPLSSLAAAGAPKNTPQRKAPVKSLAKPAGSPGAPAAAAGKAGAKARPKSTAGIKRRASSSSSSTYSYSSSSDSEDGKPIAPKRTNSKGSKGAVKKKAPPVKKNRSQEEGLGDDSGGAVKKRDRSKKEDIVAQLLCRWWFAEEYRKQDWPPQEESFYQERLAAKKLRKVTIQEWEWLPETDEKGLKKVYELSQFRGVYRDSAGDMVDLRPEETCPCLNNFMKKDMVWLCQMLISAYENQLRDLKNCRYINEAEKTATQLRVSLTKAQKTLHEASAMK